MSLRGGHSLDRRGVEVEDTSEDDYEEALNLET